MLRYGKYQTTLSGRIASKFGVVIGTQDVITCVKFGDDRLRGFWLAGAKVRLFPLTLLVVLTTVLRYRVHCDVLNNHTYLSL